MSRPALAALAALLALLALNACGGNKPPPPADRITLDRQAFGDLPGWRDDDVAAAIPALLTSCGAIGAQPDAAPLGLDMVAGDWRAPCLAAAALRPEQAREFFETRFTPFRIRNNDDAQGLFTGYYEAELHGARQPGGAFTTPIYRRPPDLISVDLGLFRPEDKGARIAGKLAGNRLVPYATRAEIDKGALAGKGLELLWVDNPIDAFFLEVQGSGRVILADGGVVRLGYDGENGHAYVAIGRILVEQGVPKDDISMPYLRDWIATHGADGLALMERNPSYIFFRQQTGPGPVGAQGVALTPGRSAAVDRRFVPLGLPLWVDTTDPVEPGGRLRRLLIAQDTGGAIRGPVRADLFFGYGADAARHAGLMKGRGGDWVLLPNAAAARRAPGT